MILEACWVLGLTRVALRILPFRWIASLLQRHSHAHSALGIEQTHEARRIGWAVAAVGRSGPLRAVCLGQAVAAHSMLKRRGIPAAVHLGVAEVEGGLKAHAWASAGDLIVTGERGHQLFTEVSRIGSL